MSITEHVAKFAATLDADPAQAEVWQTEAAAGITAIVHRARWRGFVSGFLAGLCVVSLGAVAVRVLS